MKYTTVQMGADDIARAIFERAGGDMRAVKEPLLLKDPLPAGVWEFSQRCCFTFDQRASEFGRGLVEKFPDKIHLRLFLEALCTEPLVWVQKSVQIMVSWAVAVWALHDVLTHRGHEGAWFCLDRKLAEKHIRERVWRLYQAIPSTYSKPDARIVGGVFYVYHDGLGGASTSSITPMAQETSKEDQAGKRAVSWPWTWALLDECARTAKAGEIIRNLMNRCGKIIAPSSVGGMATWHHQVGFAKTMEARDMFDCPEPVLLPGALGRPAHGIRCWRRFGWYCMEILYCADPAKNPRLREGQAWWNHPNTVASRAETAAWARDMECDASVASGRPVFSDTERIVRGPLPFMAWLPLHDGHDYSWRQSAMVAAQVYRREDGRAALRCLLEVGSENSYIEPHKRRCKAALAEAFGEDVEHSDFGDYSATQHTSTGVIIEQMLPEFRLITVPTGSGGVLLSTNLTQSVISHGLLEIDDGKCPMLWRALESGYLYDDAGEPVQSHPWSDYARALGYLITNIFELRETGDGAVMPELKEPFTRALIATVADPRPYEPTSGRDRVAAGGRGWRGVTETCEGTMSAEFSLRGIYRVDAFRALPGAVCALCVDSRGGARGVPAVARVIEYGGDIPASWVGRVASLVDPAGNPLANRAESTAVRDPFKRERCLCRAHRDRLQADLEERNLGGVTFEKYPTKFDYGSINELPPEWQEEYRQLQEAREDKQGRIVRP